jgi:hypothetical protein
MGAKVMDSNGSDPTTTSATTAVKGISAWKKQLITHEDPMHVHKTIGILCMVSYLFRLVQTGPSDMGFVTYPSLTIPTILLHLCLNMTSLVFKIPARRISSGYRIWPEYRLHSLVFLCRALAVMALYYYEQTYHTKPYYDINLIIVVLGMMAADYSSYTQRQYRSSTIRDLDTSDLNKFLFSVAQFCGTTNILYGIRYRYSIQMLAVIVVQCNAFMMTVRRKNLAGHSSLVAMYGFALFVSMSICVYEFNRIDPKNFFATCTVTNIAVVQRMAPIWPESIQHYVSNKYVVWMTVGLLVRQTRSWIDMTATRQDAFLLYMITSIPVFVLGWYKCAGPGATKHQVIKKVE